jgi:hypothetical protein
MTISFMGRPYEEDKIIGYAYDYEQATNSAAPRRSFRRCRADNHVLTQCAECDADL